MSSRSITFRRGLFHGWKLSVIGETVYGEPVRTLVMIGSPYDDERGGVLTFLPSTPGFDVTRAALEAGQGESVAALEAVARWVIEATREALNTRTDLSQRQANHWRAIVNDADVTRADWKARYLDELSQPPAELVGVLTYDEVRGLAAAR